MTQNNQGAPTGGGAGGPGLAQGPGKDLGKVVLKRQVKVDAAGTLEQTLTITPNEISKQTRGRRYYAETTLRRSRLSSYDIPAIHFLHGVETEGNNHWHSVMIIPIEPSQIDAIWNKIKDFDTFEAVAKCLHEICNRGGQCNTVVCDLNACCLTLMRDLKPCII